jgi:hypothetical protein
MDTYEYDIMGIWKDDAAYEEGNIKDMKSSYIQG